MSNSKDLAFKVCPHNYSRALVLEKFIEFAELHLIKDSKLSIGVLGGSKAEPEVVVLEKLGYEFEVKTIGIENSDFYLDFNYPQAHLEERFDLLLCSQVLEHLWNHKNFFNLLRILGKKYALIWLAAPAMNHPHGSPNYFAAGFTGSYLSLNLNDSGYECLVSGNVGTRRLYFATSILRKWLTVKEHNSPLVEIINPRNIQRNLYYKSRIFDLFRSKLKSPKVSYEIEFATDSWVGARFIG